MSTEQAIEGSYRVRYKQGDLIHYRGSLLRREALGIAHSMSSPAQVIEERATKDGPQYVVIASYGEGWLSAVGDVLPKLESRLAGQYDPRAKQSPTLMFGA